MIHMLIVDRVKEEAELLHREARRQAAYLTEDRWEIRRIGEWQKEETAVLDIAYLDVTTKQGLSAAEQVRKNWKSAYMVLIISKELSPLKYLRPTIMAASVLLRPFQKAQAEESIREAISFLPSEKSDEEVFILSDRDGKVRLPCRDIDYQRRGTFSGGTYACR